MGRRNSFICRYLSVIIIFGIFLLFIDKINEFYSLTLNLFSIEQFDITFKNKEYKFDEAYQRLLHTHYLAYNNPNTTCEKDGKLNEKDENILNSAIELLPKLKSLIISYPEGQFNGRGIVLTLGPNQLLHTRMNIRIIEWLKTKLSVEIWYSSSQITKDIINDLLSSTPTLNIKGCCFETFNCHTFNGKEYPLIKTNVYSPVIDKFHGKIYSFKLAAIISSTFDEIIFIDSDCYIVKDPIDLFDHDLMYQKFGALLYPDIYMSHQHAKIWQLLNSTCIKNEFSIDSGVLILNKKRLWNGLYLAKLMGDHHQIFYNHFFSNGDKDTFRLAFRYLNIPYYIVGIPCSTGYIINNTFCGVTLCKTDSLALNVYFDHIHHPKHLTKFNFTKDKYTHTRIAIADPNIQTYMFGYCGLHSLPCFQVGFKNPSESLPINTYCETSALVYDDKPFIYLSSKKTILWNPNLEKRILIMKKSSEIMPGYIDFYFQVQNEPLFKNAKL